jgi:membrane-associated phospholipid phosphatase
LEPRTRTRIALLLVAAVALVLFVVVYVFAVRTSWGQRVDAAALRGRNVLSKRDLRIVGRLHAALAATFVLFGAALFAVAVMRRKIVLGLGVGALVLVSVGTAELCKYVLLSRPMLSGHSVIGSEDPTYPSGHMAAAMALAVGAAYIAPLRLRTRVAVVGALFAAIVGWMLVATTSHRPSDSIGSALMVTAYAAILAMVFVGGSSAEQVSRPGVGTSRWVAFVGIAFAVGSLAILAETLFAIRYEHGFREFGAFLAAGSAIAGVVLIGMGALLLALVGEELDRLALSAFRR